MMLTYLSAPGYDPSAVAKSAAGFDSLQFSRRNRATMTTARFFVPSVMAAVRGSLRAAGPLESQSVNLRTVAHPSIDSELGDSTSQGVRPMAKLCLFPTRNPSARASAHRAMARAALFSDSSARVRMRRYNAHMTKARRLEAAARGEGVVS